MIPLDPSTLATLLIYSTRYCLGRASYAPGEVCDLLRAYAPRLSKQDRAIIKRDIKHHLNRETCDPCREYWVRVVGEI